MDSCCPSLPDLCGRRACVNISIDTLRPERFQAISRTGELGQALAGIEAAQRAGFENIKLNAVILAGVNDDEVLDLAKFAVSGGMDISFIEEMPLGHIDSHKRAETQVFSERIRQLLSREFDLVASAESTGGPARYFRIPGRGEKIGFISPMSDNFCASCNRVDGGGEVAALPGQWPRCGPERGGAPPSGGPPGTDRRDS